MRPHYIHNLTLMDTVELLLISRILYGVQDYATHFVTRRLALGAATASERFAGVVHGTAPPWSRLHGWLRPFGHAVSTKFGKSRRIGARRAPDKDLPRQSLREMPASFAMAPGFNQPLQMGRPSWKKCQDAACNCAASSRIHPSAMHLG